MVILNCIYSEFKFYCGRKNMKLEVPTLLLSRYIIKGKWLTFSENH